MNARRKPNVKFQGKRPKSRPVYYGEWWKDTSKQRSSTSGIDKMKKLRWPYLVMIPLLQGMAAPSLTSEKTNPPEFPHVTSSTILMTSDPTLDEGNSDASLNVTAGLYGRNGTTSINYFDDADSFDLISTLASPGNGSNEANGNKVEEVWLRNFFSMYIEMPSTRLQDPVYMWIRFTVLTILVPAGLAGNLLTMVIMTRPNLRNHPVSSRFGALAFCDFCCCLIRGITWLRLGFALSGALGPISFDNDHWCRFSEYFFTAIHISESWIVVYITLERAIYVVLPIKGPLFCRQSLVKVLLPVCLVGPFVITSYLPLVTVYKPHIGCATKAYPDMYFHFITATTSVSMIPLTLIFLSNVSIVISLRRNNQNLAHSNRSDKFRRVTNMVLAVSLAFLTTVFPQAANALMAINNPHWTWLKVTDDVAAVLWDTNYAINFYLYVITGNQVREELRRMFRRQNNKANNELRTS